MSRKKKSLKRMGTRRMMIERRGETKEATKGKASTKETGRGNQRERNRPRRGRSSEYDRKPRKVGLSEKVPHYSLFPFVEYKPTLPNSHIPLTHVPSAPYDQRAWPHSNSLTDHQLPFTPTPCCRSISIPTWPTCTSPREDDICQLPCLPRLSNGSRARCSQRPDAAASRRSRFPSSAINT